MKGIEKKCKEMKRNEKEMKGRKAMKRNEKNLPIEQNCHAPPPCRTKLQRPCAPAPRVYVGRTENFYLIVSLFLQAPALLRPAGQKIFCEPNCHRLAPLPVVANFARPAFLYNQIATPRAPLRPASERADFEGGLFLPCWGYIRTYVRTYVRTHVRTDVGTCVRTHARTYVCTYVRT